MLACMAGRGVAPGRLRGGAGKENAPVSRGARKVFRVDVGGATAFVALHAVLAGRAVTPSVFDMMLVLGQDEVLARLTDAA